MIFGCINAWTSQWNSRYLCMNFCALNIALVQKMRGVWFFCFCFNLIFFPVLKPEHYSKYLLVHLNACWRDMVLFSEKGSMTFFSPSMPDWIKIINVSCSESNDFLFYTLICFSRYISFGWCLFSNDIQCLQV